MEPVGRVLSAGVDEAGFVGDNRRLGAVFEVQLLEDVDDACLDSCCVDQ